jgi:hypothetical protein
VWGRILEGDEKPGIQETEVERSWLWEQPGLYSETLPQKMKRNKAGNVAQL